MKQKKKYAAFNCSYLTSFLFACTCAIALLFTSCPNANFVDISDTDVKDFGTVYIDVKAGDTNVSVTGGNKIMLDLNASWSSVKSQAAGKLSFQDGYEFAEWSLNAEGGETLSDDYKFEKEGEVIVYAFSKKIPEGKKIEITVQGDDHVENGKGYTFSTHEGVKWSEIKKTAEDRVSFTLGYNLKEWHLTNKDGEIITEETVFNTDSTVFAVSQKIPETKVTITIMAGSNVSVASDNHIIIDKNTRWKAVKEQASQKITSFTQGYEFDAWRLKGETGKEDQGEKISDEHTFTIDTEVYVTARSAINKEADKVIIYVIGDSRTRSAKGVVTALVKDKTVKWKDIKYEAEKALTIEKHYIIKKWHYNDIKGAVIGNEDTFKEKENFVYASTEEDPKDPPAKGSFPGSKGNEVNLELNSLTIHGKDAKDRPIEVEHGVDKVQASDVKAEFTYNGIKEYITVKVTQGTSLKEGVNIVKLRIEGVPGKYNPWDKDVIVTRGQKPQFDGGTGFEKDLVLVELKVYGKDALNKNVEVENAVTKIEAKDVKAKFRYGDKTEEITVTVESGSLEPGGNLVTLKVAGKKGEYNPWELKITVLRSKNQPQPPGGSGNEKDLTLKSLKIHGIDVKYKLVEIPNFINKVEAKDVIAEFTYGTQTETIPVTVILEDLIKKNNGILIEGANFVTLRVEGVEGKYNPWEMIVTLLRGPKPQFDGGTGFEKPLILKSITAFGQNAHNLIVEVENNVTEIKPENIKAIFVYDNNENKEITEEIEVRILEKDKFSVGTNVVALRVDGKSGAYNPWNGSITVRRKYPPKFPGASGKEHDLILKELKVHNQNALSSGITVENSVTKVEPANVTAKFNYGNKTGQTVTVRVEEGNLTEGENYVKLIIDGKKDEYNPWSRNVKVTRKAKVTEPGSPNPDNPGGEDDDDGCIHHGMIIVKVLAGDKNVRLRRYSGNLIRVPKGRTWQEIKTLAYSKLRFGSGYELKNWVADKDEYIRDERRPIRVDRLTVTAYSKKIPDYCDKEDIIINGVKHLTMKAIPGKSNFNLGDYDDPRYGGNSSIRTASVSAFKMSDTEVTEGLYEEIMLEYYRNGRNRKKPVTDIGFLDAVRFCNLLTERLMGAEHCAYKIQDTTYYTVIRVYRGRKGFRIPTEAEWEWAARGEANNTWSGTSDSYRVGDYAVFFEKEDGHPFDSSNYNGRWIYDYLKEVKTKKPNQFGLYDMSGNAAEYCYANIQKRINVSNPPYGWLGVNPDRNDDLSLYKADDEALMLIKGGDAVMRKNGVRASFRNTKKQFLNHFDAWDHIKYNRQGCFVGFRIVQDAE